VATAEKPKVDERFIEIIEGREFIKFGGLLHLAHEKGISRIETEIIQLPTPENGNSAIIRAIVESKEGDLFSGIGDCSPANCHPKVAKHLLRIAETRAIARCLKLHVDSPFTCLEELADASEVLNGDNSSTPSTTGKTRGRKLKETTPPPGSNNGGSGGNPTQKISEAQRQAILNLSRRKGLTALELEKLIKETYRSNLIDLTQSQASALIHSFQKQKSA
jgi:hypothetical protein